MQIMGEAPMIPLSRVEVKANGLVGRVVPIERAPYPVGKPKKISLLVVLPWLIYGGMETFVRRFVRFLDRNMFEVEILAFEHADNCTPEFITGFCPIHLRYCSDADEKDTSYKATKEFLRDRSYDLVMVNASAGALKAVIEAGIPRFLVLHGLTAEISKRGGDFTGTPVVCVSDTLRKFVEGRGGLDKLSGKFTTDILVTIDNGLPIDEYGQAEVDKVASRLNLGIPEGAPLIGWVGRLGKNKLGVLHEVIQVSPSDWHWLIVGNGWVDKESEEFAGQLKVRETEGRVHWLRTVPPESMPLAYKLMDCYCTTSIGEGFGYTIAEAAACAIPAVGSDVIGVRSTIIDGVTGYLTNDADAKGFVEKIAFILKHREATKKYAMPTTISSRKAEVMLEGDMGVNALLVARQKWDIRKMCRKYEQLCYAILERYPVWSEPPSSLKPMS